MATEVSWMLELSLNPGHEAEFTALVTEIVAVTSTNEAGALTYEWSLSADGATCHIFERYADSAAVLTHPATSSSASRRRRDRCSHPRWTPSTFSIG
jgi:quinol monooxygenase YgiN